jgi:hypothetical protein
MANPQLKQGFITEDGSVFATAAEAHAHIRAPLVAAAMLAVAGGDQSLATFLIENKEELVDAFEVGTVARVTKQEKKKLAKALEELATIDNPKLAFLKDNASAIESSFRWPAVKRMSPEEKDQATFETLTAMADENAAKWIIANKDAILASYQAGIEKRAPNPKAMEALAASREKRMAETAARKAAEEAASPVAAV